MKLEALKQTIESKAVVFGEEIAKAAIAAFSTEVGQLFGTTSDGGEPVKNGKPPKAKPGRKAKAKGLCAALGCDRPATVKGLCSKHYQAARRGTIQYKPSHEGLNGASAAAGA